MTQEVRSIIFEYLKFFVIIKTMKNDYQIWTN